MSHKVKVFINLLSLDPFSKINQIVDWSLKYNKIKLKFTVKIINFTKLPCKKEISFEK